MQNFHVGDQVVYKVCKCTTHPGPRARQVRPAPRGETYSYVVDKYWIVADWQDAGKLVVRTRRGKAHVIDADDPRLRRATWWERWLHRHRFPELPPHGRDNPAPGRS